MRIVLFMLAFFLGGCQLYAQNMNLKREAEKGNMVAQCRYAESLTSGTFPTRQKLEEAVFWYKKSAEQGYSPAQRQLGDAYFYGNGVEKDVQLAVEWYKAAAAQNNPVAQYNLGVCYTSGIGVPQSSGVAAVFYRKSAENGYGVAQNALGKCFLEGNGVSQDYMIAVSWFQKAMAQGNVYARYNLGRCYSLGLGVIRNLSKAVELYQECAEEGHTAAQYRLGLSYLEGAGVKKDSILAAKWLLASAGGGNLISIRNTFDYDAEKANKESRDKLFELATESSLGLQSYLYVLIGYLLEAEANYEEAEKYYKQAIGLGNFLGAAKLGLMYFYINANDESQENYLNDHAEGLQLESLKNKDYAIGAQRFLKNKQWKANDNTAYWLEKAIENNYGLFSYGSIGYLYDYILCCYYDGIGSSKDIVKAIDFSYKFITDAIDDSNCPIINAEFVLAQELENGQYAQYAFEAYKELYRLATTNDSKYSSRLLRLAAAGLGKAYYKGFGIQLNYEKAFEYLTISANLGNSESMRLLAACYRYGRGTAVDSVKENEWLEKATKRRADKKAKQILERRKKNIIEDAF